jgi:hypothetical protein
MAEMRVHSALRFAAVVLVVAACVPRPTALTSPSDAGTITTAAPSETTAPSETGLTGPTPIPSFVRPTPLPAPTFLAYVVTGGDTLTSIARAYRTTPRSIAFWSRGDHPSLDPESAAYEPNRLEVGWILLLIPDAVFDEDELPDATPTATTAPSPAVSPSPTAS